MFVTVAADPGNSGILLALVEVYILFIVVKFGAGPGSLGKFSALKQLLN
jgi:hypothetical protein